MQHTHTIQLGHIIGRTYCSVLRCLLGQQYHNHAQEVCGARPGHGGYCCHSSQDTFLIYTNLFGTVLYTEKVNGKIRTFKSEKRELKENPLPAAKMIIQ